MNPLVRNLCMARTGTPIDAKAESRSGCARVPTTRVDEGSVCADKSRRTLQQLRSPAMMVAVAEEGAFSDARRSVERTRR